MLKEVKQILREKLRNFRGYNDEYEFQPLLNVSPPYIKKSTDLCVVCGKTRSEHKKKALINK